MDFPIKLGRVSPLEERKYEAFFIWVNRIRFSLYSFYTLRHFVFKSSKFIILNSSIYNKHKGAVTMEDTQICTEKYKHFNHYHELTDQHQIVDFGDGEFIANVAAIPLLKALNELGLKTRTHHVDDDGGFFSILIDKVKDMIFSLNHINEAHRRKYDGETELLIQWRALRDQGEQSE